MTPKIGYFHGEDDFLSNFPDCTVTLDGVEYRSVEHAYQAAKTLDPAKREIFTLGFNPHLKAHEAKKIGRKLKPIRPDWDTVKEEVMLGLLKQKFGKAPFREKLIATGDAYLEEGNWWHDIYWGVCRGGQQDEFPAGFYGKTCRERPHEPFGRNRLGLMLMYVRGVVRG